MPVTPTGRQARVVGVVGSSLVALMLPIATLGCEQDAPPIAPLVESPLEEAVEVAPTVETAESPPTGPPVDVELLEPLCITSTNEPC